MAENVSNDEKFESEVELRFHPTDVELINQYLIKKVVDSNFNAIAIAEVEMNKKEPWDLPGLAKMGETEWYFFSLRNKKYPTGLRMNRATALGYWRATGKDKQIIEAHALIGMKKTLVFYIGRAPKGEKTNWVMHEYRLEDNKYNLPKPGKGEWVICRVYKKASRGKKAQVPKFGPSPTTSLLPPLMETSPYNSENTACDLSQVTCFSDQIIAHNQEIIEDNNIVDSKETPIWDFSPFGVSPFPNATPPLVFNQPLPQVAQQIGNSQHGDFFQPQEPSTLRMLMENNGSSVMVNQKVDCSLEKDYAATPHISPMMNNDDMFQRWFENQEHSSATSVGSFDFDCSWDY